MHITSFNLFESKSSDHFIKRKFIYFIWWEMRLAISFHNFRTFVNHWSQKNILIFQLEPMVLLCKQNLFSFTVDATCGKIYRIINNTSKELFRVYSHHKIWCVGTENNGNQNKWSSTKITFYANELQENNHLCYQEQALFPIKVFLNLTHSLYMNHTYLEVFPSSP